MKRFLLLLAALIVVTFAVGCVVCTVQAGQYETEKRIKLAARAASVQILHIIPGLKVTFTTPLPESKKIENEKQVLELLEERGLTREAMAELLEEKELTPEKIRGLIESVVEGAIEDEQKRQGESKYKAYLMVIDEHYKSPSATEVPLGALAPEWARFPERVLVVQRTEKKDITAWEKEYEEDILTVSETADVSPSKARTIISTLNAKGYSIFKEEIAEESAVELLWFSNGWDDGYPTRLNWSVCVEGTETNLITGYDPRGILSVRPIPEGKIVRVVAGYLDLKDQHKPKSTEMKLLESRIESLEKEIESKEEASKEKEEKLWKQLEEARDELWEEQKEEKKRDISRVTWGDIRLGIAKVEQFWMMGGGTGTYLGDMKVRDEMYGFQSSWGGYNHFTVGEEKGVILTNAHVARAAIDFNVYVSEDKEVMWIVYPGYQYVRYTQDSDLFGSPSQVLSVDYEPVLGHGLDCALVVTTKVPGYARNAAPLGDSDRVEQGDRVVMVGNPGLMQKFATEGIISNKHYDSTKDATWFYILEIPRVVLDHIRNASLWIDAPIGIGGTSGSAIWALDGREAGKVVGLHALGLSAPVSFSKTIILEEISLNTLLDPHPFEKEKDETVRTIKSDGLVRLTAEGLREQLIKQYPFENAEVNVSPERFYEENESFKPTMVHGGRYVWITGMSAGIPVNKVKTYLQERGIDPKDFDWTGIESRYWWQ